MTPLFSGRRGSAGLRQPLRAAVTDAVSTPELRNGRHLELLATYRAHRLQEEREPEASTGHLALDALLGLLDAELGAIMAAPQSPTFSGYWQHHGAWGGMALEGNFFTNFV